MTFRFSAIFALWLLGACSAIIAAQDRAAAVVSAGPAALTREDDVRQSAYLLAIGRSLANSQDPTAMLLGIKLLNPTQAMAIATPGGHVQIEHDQPGDPVLVDKTYTRLARMRTLDTTAIRMLAADVTPPAYRISGSDEAYRLVAADRENAVAWLALAAHSRSAGRLQDAAMNLRRAALATGFDSGIARIQRALLQATTSQPPPDLHQIDGQTRPRRVSALIIANRIRDVVVQQYGLHHVARTTCYRPEPELIDDCRMHLASILDRADSRETAFSLLDALERLPHTAAEQAELDWRKKSLWWRGEKLYDLGFLIEDLVPEVDATVADWQSGMTTTEVELARLRRHGIALEPTDRTWTPKPRVTVPLL